MTILGPGSMERIVPDEIRDGDAEAQRSLALHVERYQFAASVIPPSSAILDLACGVGYGARLLTEMVPASRVTGVDAAGDAIHYAKQRYRTQGLFFVQSEALQFEP